MFARWKNKRKLGERLIKAGKINQDQLEDLLQQQQRSDRYLGELAVECGHITEDELFSFLPRKATKDGLYMPNPRNALDITELYLQQTAMKFAFFSDEPIKTLQVTSAMPGEGKSTCARYLAQTSAALQNGKYLLVDADLVNPTLHKRLNIAPVPGWTDYLVNSCTLDQCIVDVGINSLKVLPAGTIPPNPAVIFGSKRMKDFINELKQRFDLVIFDSSPILPVPATTALGANLDATILVVRSGSTRRQLVKRAVNLLNESRTRIIGVVLNQVVDSEFPHKDYNYAQYNQKYSGAAYRKKAGV